MNYDEIEDRKPVDSTGQNDKNNPPSKLEEEKLYNMLKRWYLDDDSHSSEWRQRAKSNDDFVVGDQWEKEATSRHREENRVPLTFNYTLAFMKAVAGLEIGTRHETVFLPEVVEEGDVAANEVLSQTSHWMGDQCDAEDEQGEAFFNTLVSGMGWTESTMDWDASKDGEYKEESIDPQEMRWDKSARKKNLIDARRVFRARKFTRDEAQALFPDADAGDLNAGWAYASIRR